MSYIIDFEKTDTEIDIFKTILSCNGTIYTGNKVRNLLKKHGVEYWGDNNRGHCRPFYLRYINKEDLKTVVKSLEVEEFAEKLEVELVVKEPSKKKVNKI